MVTSNNKRKEINREEALVVIVRAESRNASRQTDNAKVIHLGAQNP